MASMEICYNDLLYFELRNIYDCDNAMRKITFINSNNKGVQRNLCIIESPLSIIRLPFSSHETTYDQLFKVTILAENSVGKDH